MKRRSFLAVMGVAGASVAAGFFPRAAFAERENPELARFRAKFLAEHHEFSSGQAVRAHFAKKFGAGARAQKKVLAAIREDFRQERLFRWRGVAFAYTEALWLFE